MKLFVSRSAMFTAQLISMNPDDVPRVSREHGTITAYAWANNQGSDTTQRRLFYEFTIASIETPQFITHSDRHSRSYPGSLSLAALPLSHSS